MTSDHAALNAATRKHKGALTRAQKSGDPQKVIDACDAAFAEFEEVGYPDCHANWEIARMDAQFEIQRGVR